MSVWELSEALFWVGHHDIAVLGQSKSNLEVDKGFMPSYKKIIELLVSYLAIWLFGLLFPKEVKIYFLLVTHWFTRIYHKEEKKRFYHAEVVINQLSGIIFCSKSNYYQAVCGSVKIPFWVQPLEISFIRPGIFE